MVQVWFPLPEIECVFFKLVAWQLSVLDFQSVLQTFQYLPISFVILRVVHRVVFSICLTWKVGGTAHFIFVILFKVGVLNASGTLKICLEPESWDLLIVADIVIISSHFSQINVFLLSSFQFLFIYYLSLPWIIQVKHVTAWLSEIYLSLSKLSNPHMHTKKYVQKMKSWLF